MPLSGYYVQIGVLVYSITMSGCLEEKKFGAGVMMWVWKFALDFLLLNWCGEV